MKGVFLVNAFYKSTAVDLIYDDLKKSADMLGVILDKKTNSDYTLRLDELSDGLSEYDFCIFWNKDILLAKALCKLGVKVFNSPKAIEVCDDKAKTHLALSDVVKMPKTLNFPFTYENTGYTDTDFLKAFEEELSYPYVIKESFGSLGSGVYLANDYDEALKITKKCDAKRLIAQEFIDTQRSGEFSDIRVYMVGNDCVAAMERYSNSDFRVNVGIGGNVRQYTITDEELLICQRVMKELELDYAGIDILHSDNGPIVCEVNSNAQFVALSEISGIDVADKIMNYIYERVNK